MIIYLIGARASGKTTTGLLLADALGYPFIDLDHFLCDNAGKSIAAIVEEEGWSAFRQLESQSLRKACASADGGNLVVATGGGVVLEANNRAFMRASGKVVWLNADCDVILSRLEKEPLPGQRPSFTGRPLSEETREMVIARGPIYRDCCHLEVDAAKSPAGVCQAVLAGLRENGGEPV